MSSTYLTEGVLYPHAPSHDLTCGTRHTCPASYDLGLERNHGNLACDIVTRVLTTSNR